jgi:coenzyme F420-0:L-glutamate ligase/coenzyme F420-1:gamma-L-glutamate ligase
LGAIRAIVADRDADRGYIGFSMRELKLFALPDLPLVHAGDDLGALLAQALDRAGLAPRAHDVLVVAQKIVSKAEGRQVALRSVAPSPRAQRLADRTGKDPRLVELILAESRAVLASRPGAIVVEHRLGHVMANAGIDRSNVESSGVESVLLLPVDPDLSAARVRAQLCARFDVELGVIVSDSFGRTWRNGTVGVALGVAGVPALRDLRGTPDLFGRRLEVTEVGYADEIAAAASLLMGQAAEATPAILVRGLEWSAVADGVGGLLRGAGTDLFRTGIGAEPDP